MLRFCKAKYVDGKAGIRKAAESKAGVLINRALNELVLKSRKYGKQTYDNTFLGSQLIDWLMAVECLTSREDAVAVANAVFLQSKKIKHCYLPQKNFVMDAVEGYVWVV